MNDPAPIIAESLAPSVPTLKRKGNWLARCGVTLFFLLLMRFVSDLAGNEAFNWPQIARYLFDDRILDGVRRTIALTAVSMLLGTSLAVVIAQLRLSKLLFLSATAGLFIWLFRAVPLLVVLLLIFNIGIVYPHMELGVPFTNIVLLSGSIQDWITPFTAGVIAFSLHECVYSAEVIRAAIMSVPKGQIEAAESLGIGQFTIFRRTVFPQAMKIAVPGLMNNLIGMLKGTSLIAFISVPDLMFTAQTIYMSNYELVVPMLIVVTVWYLFMVSILTLAQLLVEEMLSGRKILSHHFFSGGAVAGGER